jgi:hypothetical protein
VFNSCDLEACVASHLPPIAHSENDDVLAQRCTRWYLKAQADTARVLHKAARDGDGGAVATSAGDGGQLDPRHLSEVRAIDRDPLPLPWPSWCK